MNSFPLLSQILLSEESQSISKKLGLLVLEKIYIIFSVRVYQSSVSEWECWWTQFFEVSKSVQINF